jgi:hypothetical protein
MGGPLFFDGHICVTTSADTPTVAKFLSKGPRCMGALSFRLGHRGLHNLKSRLCAIPSRDQPPHQHNPWMVVMNAQKAL